MPFFLTEEDEHKLYSSLLVKTLLSHCIYNSIETIYFTGNKFNHHLLPSQTTISNSKKVNIKPSVNESNIAWRYNSVEPIENSLGESNITYDFGVLLTKERIDDKKLNVDTIKKEKLTQLKSMIQNIPLNTKRIIIEGLTDFNSNICIKEITWLLYQLKSLTRINSKISIFITLNSNQLGENINNISRSICDCCIEMKSFQVPSTSYPDFDGLFLVHKLPTVNTICSRKNLDTLDLGFVIKNGRYLSIDTLTLPPDINDRSTMCKPALPKLDF